ncbi:MAG TPA: RluA family pseudouridine synthase [Thermoleophilaceae bacterium]|jgi:23S rRNA pseudouridine1911/1915/1917 synthase|nr:RluA family pseudouridine synthase [Thermoleophilaceae bacterium]
MGDRGIDAPALAVAFVAVAEDAGERLDVRLAAEAPVGSRAKAQRLIDAGLVTVDGRQQPKRHRLSAGERVEARIEQPPAPDDPRAGEGVPYEVVYEDDDLLVVDKPAGVVVHPAPGHPTGTLSQALAARGGAGGDPLRPGIVHRLDRDTSGLLVVAKSEPVHRALQEMIRRREVERIYLALVEGRPAGSGTIDAAVGRDRRERRLMSVSTDTPREAITHFELIERLPRTSLLRVRLETGRTHQIRAHMAAIDHPICGDFQYGGGSSGERFGLTRQFLHSADLRFRHPTTGAKLGCESKLPADLLRTLEVARREPVSEGPDGD